MPANTEIKIRVPNIGPVRENAEKIADAGPFVLDQVDYFFPVPEGRLQLRVEQSGGQPARAELISYHRSNEAAARTSDYILCPIPDPDLLRSALEKVLGAGVVVRKRRELFLIGRTRIHLDEVDSLGSFVEIEVVMGDDEDEATGCDELQRLLAHPGVADCQIESVAYADLLEKT